MKLSEELNLRGLVSQISCESLADIVDGEKRTVYLGIDPTADSMHVGNLAVLMLLKRFADGGHKVVLLVGGGTGMIGDPKPDVERPLSDPEEVSARTKKLKAQAEKLLGTEVLFVNNYDWLGTLNLIEFLRDTGKHFTVNELIKKEAISRRLEGETGISYTEFAYPLLQAYDYLMLNRSHGCDVQVGASDQWGNIVSGVDLIRRVEQKTVYALTAPLVIDKATGKKFGKSEGNAVWLDGEKTSPYSFYQFWLNASDENVGDYLKIFTTLSLEEIDELMASVASNPGAREAQRCLAGEVTKLVHGNETAEAVSETSEFLFGDKPLSELSPEAIKTLRENAPICKVTVGESLVEVLVKSGLASSKREAREFVEGGGISVNGSKVTDLEAVMEEKMLINGLSLLRRGKKNYSVLEVD